MNRIYQLLNRKNLIESDIIIFQNKGKIRAVDSRISYIENVLIPEIENKLSKLEKFAMKKSGKIQDYLLSEIENIRYQL